MVDRGRMVWGAGQGPRHLPYRASSNTGDTSSHDQQSDFLTVQWYIISAYHIYCTFNPAVRPTQLICDWIFYRWSRNFFCKYIFQWALTLRKYTDNQIFFFPCMILCLGFQTPSILLISLAHQLLATRYRNHFIYGISQGNPSNTMLCWEDTDQENQRHHN